MTEMLGTILVPGVKYRIVWKTPAMKYYRESIMQFLSIETIPGTDLVLYFWSARPVAGTQEMRKREEDMVVSVERVSSETACVLNRVIPGNWKTEHTA